jgi:hypothetical protein
LKTTEEAFWSMSLRRLNALVLMKEIRRERIEKEREMIKQNKALEQLRAL